MDTKLLAWIVALVIATFPVTGWVHAQNANMSYWMTNLPTELHSLPLTSLAIPGSHDSGSFNLDTNGPVGPDHETGILQILSKLFPWVTKPFVKRWSQTQTLNITEQLSAGIRYFDVRVGEKPVQPYDRYFFVHALYGVELSELFQEVNTFLNNHEKEIVLIDLNHFYGMDSSDHKRLIQSISSIFGSKLVRLPKHKAESVTLQSCWDKNWQVLVFYQDSHRKRAHHLLWPAKRIDSPWKETSNLTKLLELLTQNYTEHESAQKNGVWPKNTFYVTQGILAMDARIVLEHLREDLLTVTRPVTTAVVAWAESIGLQKNNTFNIIISDAVDTNNFCEHIVNLNYAKTA